MFKCLSKKLFTVELDHGACRVQAIQPDETEKKLKELGVNTSYDDFRKKDELLIVKDIDDGEHYICSIEWFEKNALELQ